MCSINRVNCWKPKSFMDTAISIQATDDTSVEGSETTGFNKRVE